MNRRERFLAIIVAAMLVVLTLYIVGGRINRMFTRRRTTQDRLQIEVNGKEEIIRRGKRTVRRLSDFKQKSLPANQALARSQYQAWLSEIVHLAELEAPQVKYVSQAQLANESTQLTFNVNVKGDLRQISRFLEEFYKLDTLHRIRRLPLSPIDGTKLLQTNIMIDALVVSTADERKNLDISAVSPFANSISDDYLQPILARNMFSAENRPPSFSRPSPERVELGSSLSLDLRARDPDGLDKLHFSLGDDAPEGLRIDPDSGRVSWRPEELGEVSFSVSVQDDGIPRLTDSVRVTVRVVERSVKVARQSDVPPKSEFDDARFTYAVAVTEVNGERQVWLLVRTSGKVLKLKKGDKVSVGSVQGVVTRIDDRAAVVESNGETLTVGFGQPLVQLD